MNEQEKQGGDNKGGGRELVGAIIEEVGNNKGKVHYRQR